MDDPHVDPGLSYISKEEKCQKDYFASTWAHMNLDPTIASP